MFFFYSCPKIHHIQGLVDFWSDPAILFWHSYNPADIATSLSLQPKKVNQSCPVYHLMLTRRKKEGGKKKKATLAPIPPKQQQNQLWNILQVVVIPLLAVTAHNCNILIQCETDPPSLSSCRTDFFFLPVPAGLDYFLQTLQSSFSLISKLHISLLT